MKNRNITGLLIALLFIISATFYYLYDTNRTEKLLSEINNEFPAVDFDSNISGFIMSIENPHSETFRNSSHHAFVVINESIKRRINSSNELSNDSLSLDDILSVGGFLLKNPRTDTFFIYKIKYQDTLKYSFRLNSDFGYPLRNKAD